MLTNCDLTILGEKMKKTILALSLLATFTTQAFANTNSCVEKYQYQIENNLTVTDKLLRMDEQGGATWQYMGYLAGIAVFGTSTGAIVGYTAVPVLFLAEDLIENGIHDARLTKMVRVITQSRIMLGLEDQPAIRTDVKQEIAVDGTTKKERRAQKRHNRKVRRHNRRLVKYNQALAKEKEKREEGFAKLVSKLSEQNSFVEQEDVARLIVDADESGILCDGSVQTMGRELEMRGDFVQVNGETKRERRQQRRHNRKVERHNSRVNKKLLKHRFTKQNKLIKYLNEQILK